jgi:hypothetical protein
MLLGSGGGGVLVGVDALAELLAVTAISVGVGTGGWFSDGNVADGVGRMTGGAVVATGAAEGAVAGSSSVVADAVGLGRNFTVVTGLGAARSGAEPTPFPAAAPSPPVPPGAPSDAGSRAGVASDQPIATEIGRPRATSPKKMVLGDNRTSRTPDERQ